MSPNNHYNFPESKLGPVPTKSGYSFAKDRLDQFKALINSGTSFTLSSMPGVGASYFLKYLSCQDFAKFIHVDLYELPSLNQHEFYRMFLRELGGDPSGKSDEQVFIETREILKKLAQKYDKIVIIFSRFDQLKNDLDENFLSNLQGLTTLAPTKTVLIFTAIKPLHELAPEAVTGGNLLFYSKILYFKPYSREDLKKLLTIDPEQINPDTDLDKLIELSGGHNQLLHILLNSQKQQNLLLDQFVKLQLKGLLDYLDYQQRKQVQKIALGKKISEVDEYLLGVGLVKQSTPFQLFTPLLADYIKQNLPIKLPVKEAKLLKLLRNNMGKIVSKDEIFQIVWSEDQEASDWALDALIYRLRKHPFMQANNYVIESHKKVGYSLIQA